MRTLVRIHKNVYKRYLTFQTLIIAKYQMKKQKSRSKKTVSKPKSVPKTKNVSKDAKKTVQNKGRKAKE